MQANLRCISMYIYIEPLQAPNRYASYLLADSVRTMYGLGKRLPEVIRLAECMEAAGGSRAAFRGTSCDTLCQLALWPIPPVIPVSKNIGTAVAQTVMADPYTPG